MVESFTHLLCIINCLHLVVTFVCDDLPTLGKSWSRSTASAHALERELPLIFNAGRQLQSLVGW